MKPLSREQLLGTGRASETVPVPALGGSAIVSEMSALDAEQFWLEVAALREAGRPMTSEIEARLLVRSLVDERGERLLHDDDVASLPAHLSGLSLRLLADVAWRLNTPPQEAIDAAKKP
ncbi:hypothetical protein [Jeongeupia chitinilytica]|uniref:Uncharacterized protein n=1 Tax=Jeongeupia chitinilytica TaxID=1041641 RepID=A0ABQ3H0Y1_9NEIS|nr:hypothetical protein [Jeongeupia chitinilytica]GHD59517.1 hypothetical protein GCM10007350_11110 [Jeongeupia chitinilytica]